MFATKRRPDPYQATLMEQSSTPEEETEIILCNHQIALKGCAETIFLAHFILT